MNETTNRKLAEELKRLIDQWRESAYYADPTQREVEQKKVGLLGIIFLDHNRQAIIAALKAMDALPRTADDKKVPPGTEVYRIRDDGNIQASIFWECGAHHSTIYFRGAVHREGLNPSQCYSSRELALAALAASPDTAPGDGEKALLDNGQDMGEGDITP